MHDPNPKAAIIGIAGLELGDDEAALLRGWDAEVRAESAAAALFELWWAMLQTRLQAVLVPPARKAPRPAGTTQNAA